jgi:hypothetical protein
MVPLSGSNASVMARGDKTFAAGTLDQYLRIGLANPAGGYCSS